AMVIEPPWTFGLTRATDAAGLVLFLGGGAVMSVLCESLHRAAARARAAEGQLRETAERFARFMRHLPGLAWLKDAAGRYVFANDAPEQAFGVSREQLYGRTDEEVFPPPTAEQFRENDRKALAGSGVQTIETLRHPDGSVHHSVVSKFPIPAPDGGPHLV